MNNKLAREQVGKIVSDPLFGSSSRISRFLQFIVEETLNGSSDRLKAYSIALSVFDRDHSFDPQRDSIVRVQAKRLRMQLQLYYNTTGRTDPVLIEIPKGSYVPKFSFRSEPEIDDLRYNTRRNAFERPASGVPVVALYPCTRLYSAGWHETFCHGLMEELAGAFSKFQDIAVIPIGTTVPELHTTRDPIEYGRMFGADFVLETGFRGDADRARLSVKLNNTRSGRYTGTRSFDIDHDPHGTIARQEAIARELASLTAPPFGLFHTEQLKSLKSGKTQPRTAYEHLLLADTYYLDPSRATFESALAANTKAVELAPDHVISSAMLSVLHVDGYLAGLDGLTSDESMLNKGYRIATETVRRFPDSADANFAVCMAQFARGRYDEACTRGRMAIDLNPDNVLIKSDYWFFRALHGDWDRAIAELDKVGQCSTENLRHIEKIKAIDAYRVGKFETALDLFEQAYSPLDLLANLHILMCLGQLDRNRQASAKIRRLKSLRPGLSLNQIARLLSRNYQPSLARHCVEGLRRAGFNQGSLDAPQVQPFEQMAS